MRTELAAGVPHPQPELGGESPSPQDAQEDQTLFQTGGLERVVAGNALDAAGGAFGIDAGQTARPGAGSLQSRKQPVERHQAQADFHRKRQRHRLGENAQVGDRQPGAYRDGRFYTAGSDRYC